MPRIFIFDFDGALADTTIDNLTELEPLLDSGHGSAP
jgi:hypothetical protein